MMPSKNQQSDNFRYRSTQQQAPKPNAPPCNAGDRRCYICISSGIVLMSGPSLRRLTPTCKARVLDLNRITRARS
jgi:hypothetical protein